MAERLFLNRVLQDPSKLHLSAKSPTWTLEGTSLWIVKFTLCPRVERFYKTNKSQMCQFFAARQPGQESISPPGRRITDVIRGASLAPRVTRYLVNRSFQFHSFALDKAKQWPPRRGSSCCSLFPTRTSQRRPGGRWRITACRTVSAS